MPRRKNKLLVNQQNTAVLYARVSTRDQEIYGHSLEAQQKKLKEYADKHGFKVVKINQRENVVILAHMHQF